MKLRDSTGRITRNRGDGRGVQGCHGQSGLLPRLRQPHPLLPLQAAGGLPPAGARHHVVRITSYTRGLTLTCPVSRVRGKLYNSMLANWKIWTIPQMININLVPAQYRVLFANLVALVWNFYLAANKS